MLCFSVPFSGHSKGPFIVLAVTNILPFCPLTAFVWSGHTCRPPGLCDIHPCQTKAGLFRSSVYRNTSSCHGINAFSLYSQGMYPTVPPQTCLFWVVCHPSRTYLPKELKQEAQNRSFPLFPPPNHTPSCLLPLAYGLTMSYIGWVQAGGAWALRVLPFQICPRVCMLLMRLP